MVLGHFGFGLGAKKFAPRLSLGWIFLAVEFADILWPDLILLKVEKVEIQPENAHFPFNFIYYPFTHSLLMLLLWGALFGLVYWLIRKDRQSALVLAICVCSHWFLDLVVHRPDLPLYPGDSPMYGFGVWDWPVITAVIEGLLFVVGLMFYLRATKPKNKMGVWGFWLTMVLLVLGHIAGVMSPPPATVEAIGWSAQVMWVFVLLGFWVDRNRVAREL